MQFVVDASVAVKWLFPELQADAAERLLKPSQELLAPDILWAEVTSAASKKVRHNEISKERASELLRDFHRMPVKTYPSKALMQTAWEVALEAGVSVYDAIYLSLAYKHDCSLVTADRKMYDRVRLAYPQTETIWLENFMVK